MRAALLLIPLAALAAPLAFAAQDDPAMDDAMNAVDAMAYEAEMDMDMAGNDVTAFDMENATDLNLTPEEAARPAWLSDGGMWLRVAEEEDGSVWYFDAFGSDFTTSPYRVELRVDRTPSAGPYHSTATAIALDCAGRRFRIIETTEYAEPGVASPTDVRRYRTMSPIAPGDFFAQIADTVCSHAENHYGPNANAM